MVNDIDGTLNANTASRVRGKEKIDNGFYDKRFEERRAKGIKADED